MCSLISRKANGFIVCRYIALVVSVCCAFSANAQRNISQRINAALISKSTEKRKILMQQIKETDIANMPDSTLMDYYYLAGCYSAENNEFEKTIEYLVKAKEICETKLGISNNVFAYFEILKALGGFCEELNKDDDALLWYEEGLVKGFPYLQVHDETLQSYFKDMKNNSADIYEKKGHVDMANYLRGDKPLDYIGSFDYARELLHQAIQYIYKENRYSEAIALLDEAKGIFKRNGDKGKEMMQPLYREYLLCYAMMGDTKRIDALLRTKSMTMFCNGTGSFLIHDMHEVISIFMLTHYDTKNAEYYYQRLLQKIDTHNPNDVQAVNKIGEQIQFFKNVYSQIDSLESVKVSVPILSYEWGMASFRQSNLLIKIQREDEANKLCEQIYKMSVSLKEDPQNLHWFVLMNLSDYHIRNKDLDNTERYLNEQLAWLDSKKIPSDAEERGWIYNKFGIAYLNGKRYRESKNMLAKAGQILLPIYGHLSQEYATILHNKGRLAQLEGQLDEAKRYLEEAVQIQIALDGKAMDRTTQYLDEVKHAIKVRL